MCLCCSHKSSAGGQASLCQVLQRWGPGNREQQLGEEPQKSHLPPTGSLPALKSLPSPPRAAGPELTIPVPSTAPNTPCASVILTPRAAPTALSAPGRHSPALPCPALGVSGPTDPAAPSPPPSPMVRVGTNTFYWPFSAQYQLLIAQFAVLTQNPPTCIHRDSLALHSSPFSGTQQFPTQMKNILNKLYLAKGLQAQREFLCFFPYLLPFSCLH